MSDTLTPTRPPTSPEGSDQPPAKGTLVTIAIMLELLHQADSLMDRPIGHALIHAAKVVLPWLWSALVMLWHLVAG